MKVISLLTDFGLHDWFVGTMKGVMLGLCPQAAIVDVTHGIRPGDIRSGAFALAASYNYFPAGTVHVAVVDPGVGSSRAALAVQTRKYFFIGPDNGVLSLALNQESITSVRRLENRRWFLKDVSRTFHGRDVFAPVAARLCAGFPFKRVGRAATDFVHLRWPEPSLARDKTQGEVLYIDRFGNLITNVSAALLQKGNRWRLRTRRGFRGGIVLATHYQGVPKGELVAIVGSCGLMEISMNGASAAKKCELDVSDGFELAVLSAEG